MVSDYWERQQEALAALLAAREALDAVQRRLEDYLRHLEGASRVYKGYQRADYMASASRSRTAALEEAREAVSHLGDALTAWWPNLTTSYWITEQDPAA